jgi:hypothetical protein
MLGLFLILIVASFAIAAVCHFVFPDRFNIFETCIIVVGSLLIGTAVLLVVSWNSTSDYDILNGQVTSKDMERVSCEHSYQCHCHTVSSGYGKNRTSTTQCDTCYEHPYDQDWEVHSSVGEIDIDRVDSQGLIEPHRWSIVQNGDPVSRKESVKNYVLAAPNSLFSLKSFTNDTAQFGKWMPPYPHVYDYYKFDHAINTGVNGVDIVKYNAQLADIMRNIGPTKQANVILVFAPTSDRNYLNALERHWIGSKKNDIVVAIGVTHYPKIDWAGAFTFGKSAKNELLIVKMRDTLENVGDVSKVSDIVGQIRVNAEYYFNRQPMTNFEYLKHDFVPSSKALIISSIVYGLLLLILLIFFWINDVTTDGIA